MLWFIARHLLWFIPFVTAALLGLARYLGHNIQFTCKETTNPFLLTNVSYTHLPSGAYATISSVQISFQLPSSSDPKWCTISAQDYAFKDLKHHVSTSAIHLTFWFFPVLYRRTTGAWISLTMDDFRVLVYTSTMTPNWLRLMCSSTISTVLKGETLRYDHLKSDVVLGGVVEREKQEIAAYKQRRRHRRAHRRNDRDAQPDTQTLQVPVPYGSSNSSRSSLSTSSLSTSDLSSRSPSPSPSRTPHDRVRASISIRNWLLAGFHQRLYSIGALDIQLRQVRAEGDQESQPSLVFIAQETQWTRVPAVEELKSSKIWDSQRVDHWIWMHTLAILTFPITLYSLIRNPLCIVDLYFPRIDVTYPHFRVRDTDVDIQLGTFFRMEYLQFMEEFKLATPRNRGMQKGNGEEAEKEFWEDVIWAGCMKGFVAWLNRLT